MTGAGVRLSAAPAPASPEVTGNPDPAPAAAPAVGAAAVGGGLAGRHDRRTSLTGWLLRGLSLATALGLWQLLTSNDVRFWVRFDRLPTVTEVAHALVVQLGTTVYYADLGASLGRIVLGFGLAAVLGVTIGVLVGRSRTGAHLVQPLLEVLRPIPAIALVPIAILLFPTNEQGIVFITFVAAFFPIVVSTRHAVRALPTIWEEAVLTLGGGRRRVLASVVLPGILPGVFGGLSVGAGVSWICVISAEMISGEYGVGYRTWQAYTIVDYPGVVVGMLTIGMLGWLTSAAVELAGRRATHWLPRNADGSPGRAVTAGIDVGRAQAEGVRLEHLDIGYRDQTVLRGLDLTVRAREILVLLGPSGCGKSTLLRTIAGLQAPVAGRVLVDGAPVAGPGQGRTLVFQDDGLLPWRSVARNVELPLAIRGVPRAERRRVAREWIERVGLAGAESRLPRQLSGGMRQRAQLARTLASEPRLVLMDEPFGALDSQTRASMQRLLIHVWRQTESTVVFVTHDVDEALTLADRIVVLSRTGGGVDQVVEVPEPRSAGPDHPERRRLREQVLDTLRTAGLTDPERTP